MTDEDARARLYLVTPAHFEVAAFAADLAVALDAADVACVRLRLADASPEERRAAATALRPVCHDRGVALVAMDAPRLAAETGLDGVHFSRPDIRAIREARADLGADAIVGAHCGASRHAGMSAGEAGADYVSFGPVSEEAGAGEPREIAGRELFEWWREVMTPPVVADGGVRLEDAERLLGAVDFLCISRGIWRAPEGPAAAAAAYQALIDRFAASSAS